MTFMPELDDLEHNVLVGIANGKEWPAIAAELKIKKDDVKNAVNRILVTLGAENTHHAVAIGFCTGLLIPDNIDGFGKPLPNERARRHAAVASAIGSTKAAGLRVSAKTTANLKAYAHGEADAADLLARTIAQHAREIGTGRTA